MKWLEEGHDVHIIWFTDGRAGYRKSREENTLEDCEETRITEGELARIRLAEADAAGEFLGVKKENRHFLKFYDSELNKNIGKAIEQIRDIVRDAGRFVIPSNNNKHHDHQATHDIAVRIAEELNLKDLEFYVYTLYNPLKAQGDHIIKIKLGDLRFKVYEALKIHKSQFYTKDMGWQTDAMREVRRQRFGVFHLKENFIIFNINNYFSDFFYSYD